MSERRVFAYKEGKKILDKDGIPTYTFEKRRNIDLKGSSLFVKTDKKTEKVFHHEAGKGGKRR